MDLQLQYARRFQANSAYRAAVWRILCEDFFQAFIAPDAAVLDLGAGWCEFINNVRAGQKMALDLNPDTPLRAAKDVTVFSQDSVREWPVPSDSLDVVFTSNFLEHLGSKRDVELTLRQAHSRLKPAGLIICLGPNVKFARAYWDFWDHHLPISEASLAEAVRMAGFRIEKCRDRFLPFSMSQGRTPPVIAVRLYLRMPFLWRFFGQQFLVIGRKSPTLVR